MEKERAIFIIELGLKLFKPNSLKKKVCSVGSSPILDYCYPLSTLSLQQNYTFISFSLHLCTAWLLGGIYSPVTPASGLAI